MFSMTSESRFSLLSKWLSNDACDTPTALASCLTVNSPTPLSMT